ncbi:type II toxin-antitoxin system death-on-curing family toxin [Citrobacter amalonaticus]|uniref:type II toxin-antitoxin system death-on-curing family toxin n=1 Tax=Citrobacter amalonaticus TaxID=35703 RepID=UPI001157D01F|nr:type II toxin-antitoxin system death-on-curing family toxin [Citrobacter amalonaticus]QDK85536.1 type II toxin-antitoxin system death-on-curing family toxin [Citrobacter amalonaticus]
MFEFLTPEQVIEIQRDTLPNSGAPDMGRLEGALNRVKTLHFYEDCNDIFTLAAQYLIAIAKAHAFNDANKRTAFQAAAIFLLMNVDPSIPAEEEPQPYDLNQSYYLVKLTVLAAMDEANLEQVSFGLRLLSSYRNDLMVDYDDDYLPLAEANEDE